MTTNKLAMNQKANEQFIQRNEDRGGHKANNMSEEVTEDH